MKLRGIPSGDHECWCLLVTEEDFERLKGRKPDPELDVGPFAKEGSRYRYMVYPSSLFGAKSSDAKRYVHEIEVNVQRTETTE